MELRKPRFLSWNTSRFYSITETDPRDVCRDLGVDAILTGTLHLDHRGVVTIRLDLQNSAGVNLWSRSFHGSEANTRELHRQMALEAARYLSPDALPPSLRASAGRSGPGDPQAYSLYLKGTEILRRGGSDASQRALAFYDEAITLDSLFADAWVGRGAALAAQAFSALDMRDDGPDLGRAEIDRIYQEAERAFQTARRIEPLRTSAYRGLMSVAQQVGARTGRPEMALQLGAEVARFPHQGEEEILARAVGYMFGGLATKSIPLFDQVLVLNPANEGARWFRIFALVWSDRLKEALEAGGSWLATHGEDAYLTAWLARAAIMAGEEDIARDYAHLIAADYPGDAAFTLQWLGRSSEARPLFLRQIEILEHFLRRHPDDIGRRVQLGAYYHAAGQDSEAEEIERMIRNDPNVRESWDVYAWSGRIGTAAELLRRSLDDGAAFPGPNALVRFLDERGMDTTELQQVLDSMNVVLLEDRLRRY